MASLKHYLLLGGKYALLSLLPAAAVYLILVLSAGRKPHPDKETRLRKVIGCWYLSAVALGTLLGRWNNRHAPFTRGSLRLFDALREVLVSTDLVAWHQLLLNILVFVPWGLLLVWAAQNRGRRVYWWLLLLPVLIELTQFSTGLGFFELDDILLNSLGGLWGLFLGLSYVNLRKHSRTALPSVLLALLPVFVLAAGLLWFQARPYGFLREDFADARQPLPKTVDVSALSEQLPASLPFYTLETLKQSGREDAADRLFAALGLKRRLDHEDVYDDMTVFRAEKSSVYLWYYAKGDFFVVFPEGLPLEGRSGTDTVLSILSEAGFRFPNPSEREENRLLWHFVEQDGRLCDGELVVQSAAGQLTRFDVRVHTLAPSGLRPSRDAEALARAIERGACRLTEGPEGCEALVCRSVELLYRSDSKGCWRPVYEIHGLFDGKPGTLLVPAF